MGNPLGSGQEMDKTVWLKAKVDNSWNGIGVPGRYRMVSKQYTSLKWMDIPASRGNPQGEAQLAGHSRDLAGGRMPSAWRSRPGEGGGC